MLRVLRTGVWAQIGQVWLASMAANLLLYLFQVMVGRRLAPGEFGEFAALFGIVYLAGAASNAVQASVARLVAARAASGGRIDPRSMVAAALRRMLLVAGALLALAALAVPAVGPFLHLDSRLALAPVGALLALSVLAPVTQGALLGEQRFSWYSTGLVGGAAVRLLAGWAALSLGLGVTGALWAVAAGVGAGLALGLAVIRPQAKGNAGVEGGTALPGLLLPTLLAFLAVSVPSTADVLAVRHLFPAHEAGLYSGIALMGRIVLFLPLAVSVVLFPRMARETAQGGSARRQLFAGLAITCVLSGGAALLFSLSPHAALSAMLGARYTEAQGLLPPYAAAMFLFSLTVVFLYYHLARARTAYLYLVLFPLVAFQIALPYLFHDSLSQVVWLIAAANLSLVLCSGVFTLFSWVAVPALARFGFRYGRRPVFSPGRVADQPFLRLNSEPGKEETGI